MKLKMWDAKSGSAKAKATIHISGNLGFNREAADLMELSSSSFFLIATNEEDSTDNNIYLLPSRTDSTAVPISKAGGYFYLNLRFFFEEIGIDYKKWKVIYDIVKGSHESRTMFILKRRDKDIQRKGKERNAE